MKMWSVVSRRPVRGGLLSAALAGSLLLGATGCGGEEDKDGIPDDYKVVAGTQLCGGNAVSADAAKALKVITGSSRFEASGEEYSVELAATVLATMYNAPGSRGGDVCRIYTPLGTPDFDLRVTWRQVDPDATGSPSKFTLLKMGEQTLAAADKAYVQFGCKSDKVAGTSEVGHLEVGVERWGMPTEPEGNVEALKDAYATVAHSFSLAMAKELGCADNGGLPANPVLEPA
ncbi:hypothetical protein ACN6LC_006069 [Streptomyces violaceoruber]|uniref:DUF3558 domain-containing protein n=4 Tax=Streptomyces TaxID=1883 RepID=A0ABT4NW37_9ACTN|nr:MULTISPECIES: hypothetical protein [Streptomyces]MCW8122424.1 hypothetical protein [Streptomyces anthocyanicus]MCZ4633337.1 hypothetical protein [Streptomyces rubrogriseus]WSB60494.1 hypothetical protein OIE72_09750 [Streptomyces anthocyanicus]WTC11562.1 hypothetical protein OHA15_28695 [Streptomyces anthocyanicus]